MHDVRDSQTPEMRAAWASTFTELDLPSLGWLRAVRTAPSDLLATHADARPARVVRVDRGRMLLVAAGDGRLVHARDRTSDAPCVVGDWVLVAPGELALARLPRSGTIARRDTAASTTPQALAANVDLVLVAEALQPGRAINESRIRRVAALAASGDADVHVLLTGADRLDDPAQLPAQVAGVDATATSIVDGRGIDALRALLAPGTTATLVGASGSGKSSLANALLGSDTVAVGPRRGSGTGRHTTSAARLVPVPGGGLLVDTPGIRDVGMHAEVDVASLAPAGLDEFAAACRFADCAHAGEPGCAVEAAVAAGRITRDDVDAWRRLLREALRERARSDERLRRALRAEQVAAGTRYTRARRRGEFGPGR